MSVGFRRCELQRHTHTHTHTNCDDDKCFRRLFCTPHAAAAAATTPRNAIETVNGHQRWLNFGVVQPYLIKPYVLQERTRVATPVRAVRRQSVSSTSIGQTTATSARRPPLLCDGLILNSPTGNLSCAPRSSVYYSITGVETGATQMPRQGHQAVNESQRCAPEKVKGTAAGN